MSDVEDPPMPLPENLLTGKELECLNTLAAAFDQFCALPVLHPDQADQFRQQVMRAQDFVLIRPALRWLRENDNAVKR